jgi:hypothetical protein
MVALPVQQITELVGAELVAILALVVMVAILPQMGQMVPVVVAVAEQAGLFQFPAIMRELVVVLAF